MQLNTHANVFDLVSGLWFKRIRLYGSVRDNTMVILQRIAYDT